MALGRKSKLTPDTQSKIVQAIGAGNYYKAACRFGGVSYKVFREWMVKGEKAKSGKFRDFREAIRQAEAQAEVRAVAQWQSHMPDSWQASRDFLARRHPTRWMQQDRHEVSGKDGTDIKLVVNWDGDSKNEAPE